MSFLFSFILRFGLWLKIGLGLGFGFGFGIGNLIGDAAGTVDICARKTPVILLERLASAQWKTCAHTISMTSHTAHTFYVRAYL